MESICWYDGGLSLLFDLLIFCWFVGLFFVCLNNCYLSFFQGKELLYFVFFFSGRSFFL